MSQVASKVFQQSFAVLGSVAAVLFVFHDVMADEPVAQRQAEMEASGEGAASLIESARGAGQPLPAGVRALLSATSGSLNVILMFWYSWKLASVAVGLILLAVAFTAMLNWMQLRHQRALLKVQGKISGLVFEFISGVAKLRASGSEDRAFRVWARNFAEQRRISYKVGTVGNFSDVFNAIYSPITSMVIFWCLVFWLMGKKETT